MTGHKIQDKFTKLPISRQRKYQLRMAKARRCIICGKPGVNSGPNTYCLRHLVANRESSRARQGCKRRNLVCASYRLEKIAQSKLTT